MRNLAIIALMLGVAGSLLAVPPAPEIDPGTGVNAVALLAGAMLVIRSRRRKQ